MNRTLLSVILSAVLVTISSGDAQTPDANQQQRLLALIKEVQTQQAQMADNQKQIETKLADMGETVRVARIYAGRSQ
jgi:UDP-N-acetylglucosamine transferase subunit ALG13